MIALIAGVYTGKDKTAPLILWITAGMFVLLAGVIGIGGGGVQEALAARSSTTRSRALRRW